MPDSTKSRPVSTSTASSLMQDVPGAFRAGPQFMPEDTDDGEPEVTYQSLHQVVHARRAEYLRTKHVRIKIGTWNVAAFKGAEKDVGGWFVGGKGVSVALSGLDVNEDESPKEGVIEQEQRYKQKKETLPKGDPGTLPGGEDVGIYVLGLQEIVDIGSATEAFRPYTDPSVTNRWKDSMTAALPKGYRLVAEQQLIGMLLLVYAAANVADEVKSVSTTSVGTGLMGYMGNKGAVTARIVLGETTRLVFINSHMAAGADKTSLERRNWDAQQIVSRTRFDPIKDAMDLAQNTGEQIGDEDFAFWFGDLNYRLEGIPGDDVRRLLMLHTRNVYDLSQKPARNLDAQPQEATNSVKERVGKDTDAANGDEPHPTLLDEIEASEDPASLQTTLSSLLPHDELHQQINARKAFHDGWREGPITFLPTYKYDAGTVGVFDSSEKKRAPSWCDRILFRTRRDKLAYEAKIREEENARKKDAEFKANGLDQGGNDEEILYDYDPDTDGADAGDDYNEYDEYDDAEDGVVITKEGFEDEIQLEYYTAHQRVLSSDHKPLDASFMLRYEAVVPELKAKVHAEVTKELDKAENEGRPNVTVVVDRHNDTPATSEEAPSEKFEGVWFGDVRWAHGKHRSLTVANTSRVPASFCFIERPVVDGQSVGMAPKWLSIKLNGNVMDSGKIKSDTVTLEPGETCSVELELRIMSIDDVKAMNSSKTGLEDILVLRVENGRDHFIPVRGRWQESSLGRSIDKLVRIPEGGIRKLQRQKPQGKLKAAADTVTAAKAMSENLAEQPRPSEESDEPVRFSAPRELFRLTEAVEELATRVVAEWEMIHAPSIPRSSVEAAFSTDPAESDAPWDEHPAWPFDENCWSEREISHWDEAIGDACNALDEDAPIEATLSDDLPRLQRLYVLCSLLLLFLNSMPDGIITTELWTDLEKHLTENEKAKKKATNEDRRTAVQEILSSAPSHNITFILITGMLERMVQERVSNKDGTPWQPGHARAPSASSIEPPMSPTKRAGGTLKRIVTGKGAVPQVKPEKEQATTALSAIFADAVIRTPTINGEKARAGQQKRKQELIEVFLKRDDMTG